jgi:hypothetical protein
MLLNATVPQSGEFVKAFFSEQPSRLNTGPHPKRAWRPGVRADIQQAPIAFRFGGAHGISILCGKRRIIILVTVLILAGVGLYLLPSSTPEPMYGGRKLSDWLADYNFASISERHVRAEDAVRHMGTNALPSLLNWINYKGMGVMTHPREVYNEVQHTIGRGPFWGDRRKERAYQAAYAIATLGGEAKSAVPVLTRMLNGDGDRSFLAANALAHLGTNGLPPLLAALMNTNIERAPLGFTQQEPRVSSGRTRFLLCRCL